MLRASPHLETASSGNVCVTAARTACAAIVDAQLGVAKWTLSLDHEGDRSLGLGPK
jgi:hypothetical protein